MRQFYKTYRWVLLSMTIGLLALVLIAWYTLGIINKNNVIAQIDENMTTAETYVENDEDSTELLLEEFEEDYSAKTRTVAMFLSQDDTDPTDEQTLEELRVAVDAERIGVSDTEGNIIASTDLSSEDDTVRDEFVSHVTDSVYTDVTLLLDEDTPLIIAASSLETGSGGLVQIVFSGETANTLLNDVDIANFADDIPLYTSGTTALLDADSFTYISCTEDSYVGETISYDTDEFSQNKGRFDAEDEDGNKVLVKYQYTSDYIMVVSIPYETIYYTRNMVMGWAGIGGLLLILIAVLSLRMGLLHQNKEEPQQTET